MNSQIFKLCPPKTILFDFLEDVCENSKKKYAFSKVEFKKARLADKISGVCAKLKPYYYKSKLFYLTRQMVYKNFITLVRQLCKYHHVAFTSVMKYNKSKYEIIYYIFIPLQLTTA